MKLLILSIDPTINSWRTLPKKIAAIKAGLDRCQGEPWEVEVRFQPGLIPEVKEGKITHGWYDVISHPLFRKGYHHVYLHMSMSQWAVMGLGLDKRGANHVDSDFVGESYGRGDEHTKRGRTNQNQFVQNVLHEMSHELSRACGLIDITHAYHGVNDDISGIFDRIRLEDWQPVHQRQVKAVVGLIDRIRLLLERRVPQTLFHPIQYTPRIVSQRYGEENENWYPRTGHHLGTDYAVPEGTPVYAPYAGEVTAVGTHDDLGHYCHFRYTHDEKTFEERWTHLKAVPRVGKYPRAAVVAYSGNTGLSTGPHLHREKWKDAVRVDLITRYNWDNLTVDPEA